MSRFIISIVFVLSIISVQAQSLNNQEETQSLVQRVDSLEHELSYLKLTYELGTLNLDITTFSSEVFTRLTAIKLDLYNRNFDNRLEEAYQVYYESCLRKQDSLAELIEAKKLLLQ